MSQRRCMGCMNITESPVCEKCGISANYQNEPHQLPVGTMLRGQYQVGRVLGQGGFGITYLGWDTYLDVPVAIKEFYPNSLVNRESTQSISVHCYTETVKPAYTTSKERFLREAKALAKFDEEPAIVRIKSFFPENETAYIVMEYVRGTSLQKYVNIRGGRLSLEETLRILKPVMEALEAVHQTGMIHRDISPDNIMLHPKGGAKLLDFGAVRSVESPDVDKVLTKSTEAILKHGFAPMEQYQNKGSLGPWTDVYALCATIYYCVTGRVPEDAPARMMEETDPDWSGVPDITQKQKQALEKGMALRTTGRTASVGQLMKELYAGAEADATVVAEGKPHAEQKRPEEKRKETGKSSRRTNARKPGSGRRVKFIAIGIAAVVLLLVLGFLGWYMNVENGWKMEDGEYTYFSYGTQLTDSWLQDDGFYYYFDEEGYMHRGWLTYEGHTYYFGEDGTMCTGWHGLGKNTYFFGVDGVMHTGWFTYEGNRYYFGADGKMYTGGCIINGKWYRFGLDGVLVTVY